MSKYSPDNPDVMEIVQIPSIPKHAEFILLKSLPY